MVQCKRDFKVRITPATNLDPVFFFSSTTSLQPRASMFLFSSSQCDDMALKGKLWGDFDSDDDREYLEQRSRLLAFDSQKTLD